ncbi:helix-turn-helix domain-containing protein [Nocardia sp. 004]|uniref:helix-turn-helix domain-containing protein n=1 Tax=Nocardia sp. 004 TaxID=3385978 RepID=UPI0039A36F0A
MSRPSHLLAAYVAARRRDLGLTQEQLAERSNLSPSIIKKIEQGLRPATDQVLAALFTALEIPRWYFQHVMHLTAPNMIPSILGATFHRPTRKDLRVLADYNGATCYQTLPDFTVAAANQRYLDSFPGLVPGGNIIEWMLLDDRAVEAMGETGLEREAHLIVHAFKMLSFGLIPHDERNRMIDTFSKADSWERLWTTDVPVEDIPRDTVMVRDPGTGLLRPHYLTITSTEFPDRPWWIYHLADTDGPLAFTT